jgi:hypothetical protein
MLFINGQPNPRSAQFRTPAPSSSDLSLLLEKIENSNTRLLNTLLQEFRATREMSVRVAMAQQPPAAEEESPETLERLAKLQSEIRDIAGSNFADLGKTQEVAADTSKSQGIIDLLKNLKQEDP